MKRVLYGTTALLAAGLIAGPALAGAPLEAGNFDLVLDGEIQIDTEYWSDYPSIDPTLNYSKLVFTVEYTLDFEGTAVFDNGWESGFEIQIELATPGQDLETDQAFWWVSGEFGKIKLGGADAVEHDGGPPRTYNDVGLFGFDGSSAYDLNDAQHGSGASINDDIEDTSDQNKYIWEMPKVGGFNLAVNFTPNNVTYGKDPVNDEDKTWKNDLLVAGEWSGPAGSSSSAPTLTAQIAFATTAVAPDAADKSDKDLDDSARLRLGIEVEWGGAQDKDNDGVDDLWRPTWNIGGYSLADQDDWEAITPTEKRQNQGIGATVLFGGAKHDNWEIGVAFEMGTREQYTHAATNTKDGDDTAFRADFGVDYKIPNVDNGEMHLVFGFRDSTYETWDNAAGSIGVPGEQDATSVDLWLLWDVTDGLDIDFGYQNFRY
jgi:hypothetical protein